MIDYELAFCYGIIVPCSKMEEIKEALTNEALNEMEDNYYRCVNSWTAEDYFIGVRYDLDLGTTGEDFICRISDLSSILTHDINESLKDFIQFFNENHLEKFINWKPELMIINFCY